MVSHRSAQKPHSVFLCFLAIPVYFSVLFLVYFVFYWTASTARLRELEITRAAVESRSAPFLQDLNHSAGGLNVHIWVDLCGAEVHRLRQTPLFPRFPHQRLYILDFKSTPKGVQYGQRVFGFVKPALSGYYQFAISSDDTSELWLSFNDDPTKVRLVASVSSLHSSAWTMYGDYSKYPSQISRRLRLQSNTSYYIEAFHKQGVGDGHVVVYWKPPASSLFEIIPRVHLSPFMIHNSNSRASDFFSTNERMPSQTKHDIDNRRSWDGVRLKDGRNVGRVLPECSYEPSFIVNRTLKRYEGIYLIQPSSVFPDDKTTFHPTSNRRSWSAGNELLGEPKVRYVVSKFMEPLEERHPK